MTLRLFLLVACAAVPAAAQPAPVPHKAPKSAASVRSAAAPAAPRLVVAPKVRPALRAAAASGTVTVVAPTLGAQPAKAAIVSTPPRVDLTGAKAPKPGARR